MVPGFPCVVVLPIMDIILRSASIEMKLTACKYMRVSHVKVKDNPFMNIPKYNNRNDLA